MMRPANSAKKGIYDRVMRTLRMAMGLLAFSFIAIYVMAQDTLVLYGDTIRVGGLEWDMQKDWRARGTRITENKQLYGDHVRILLNYHSNRTVSEIAFGYIDRELGFVKHGPARYFYDAGPLLSKRTFREGLMQGRAEDFYADGKLKARTTMVDGRLQGPYESYYPDGTREQSCTYLRDSLMGTQRAWYSNGSLKLIAHWDMDRKTGIDSSYYEDGKLQSTTMYEDDVEDGPMNVFHRNGRQWTSWTYEKGRLVDVAFTQSKEGNPLVVGTFKNGNGWVYLYNDNGLMRERLLFRDGYLKRSKKGKE